MLQTAKRKSQNPNEPNRIDSNKKSINARVPCDPHMHGFLFARANYDTLIESRTFIITK